MSQADRHHDLLHTIMEKKKIPPPNRELLEAYINTVSPPLSKKRRLPMAVISSRYSKCAVSGAIL
jgi:hypothetical protein